MTRGKKGQSRTVEPTAGELGTYYAQKILGQEKFKNCYELSPVLAQKRHSPNNLRIVKTAVTPGFGVRRG